MRTTASVICALLVALGVAGSPATARKAAESPLAAVLDAYRGGHTFEVPAAGSVEVAFSPDEGSQALVLKVIDSARSELRLLSYSFTSPPVVAALLRAKKRGVDVQLVADLKSNTSEDRSGKARAALSALVNAGIDVRMISVYPIHHDKVIIADRESVELGSFNYSEAAAHKNSENVLVNWRNPKLAQVYLQHFARNYGQARPFVLSY